MRKWTIWLAVGVLLAFGLWALAQRYPVRPITLIVPFPPGGGTDTGARIVVEWPRASRALCRTLADALARKAST